MLRTGTSSCVMQSLPTTEVLVTLQNISPFECVYGINPLLPITLIDLPCSDKLNTDAQVQAAKLVKLH